MIFFWKFSKLSAVGAGQTLVWNFPQFFFFNGFPNNIEICLVNFVMISIHVRENKGLIGGGYIKDWGLESSRLPLVLSKQIQVKYYVGIRNTLSYLLVENILVKWVTWTSMSLKGSDKNNQKQIDRNKYCWHYNFFCLMLQFYLFHFIPLTTW